MSREPLDRWPGGHPTPREYPVDEETRSLFRRAMMALNEAKVPYAVGGAFALHWYTGFWRVAKDLDILLQPPHVPWAMSVLEALGFATRVRHEQWLAEALLDQRKIDLVFGMGNWISYVDRGYLERARSALILEVPVLVMPAEELIYSKAFVASRERYDAADIFHLLVATAPTLDWPHLLDLFGEHWELLLSHLVMFRYVYPSHRDLVPPGVLDELLARFQRTRVRPWRGGELCRGFLLDGIGTYSLDVTEWGYRDARQEAWEEREMRRLEEREEAA